jgi:tetratricopeptide (TPR) repeat protein
MRSPVSTLVALIALAGLSTAAAADDRQVCARGSADARIAACTRVLNANPADFNALANRGVAYRTNSDYERALADFDAAMRINSSMAGLYLERGLAHEGKGDHARAIADLNVAIRRDASLVSAYFGRAMAYEATGERDRASADIAAAIRLDRNLVAALYMQRGYEANAAHDYVKAVAAFEKTIDLNPGWLSAYFGRGASYEGKGDIERAVADYRKAMQLEAKYPIEQQRQQEARERLDRLSRG